MIIYLVRHADTIYNKNSTDDDNSSLALSNFGILEAGAAAKKLRTFGIERVFSSPITRATQTAKVISELAGIPVEYDDRLKEFFTDNTSSDRAKLERLKNQVWTNSDLVMPSGESLSDSISRFSSAIHSFSRLSNESIAVVSHRIVMEGFLSKVFGINDGRHGWLETASVSAISIDNEGVRKLLFYNCRYRDLRLLFRTLKRFVDNRINSYFNLFHK